MRASVLQARPSPLWAQDKAACARATACHDRGAVESTLRIPVVGPRRYVCTDSHLDPRGSVIDGLTELILVLT
jgi:hypothetical protein